MEENELRFSLPPEKYLEQYDVLVYLEDAVEQLLIHKEENPKVNPSKFFSEYFNSVKEGNHILFRGYAYVSATKHNRASFVRMFWKSFRHIGRKGDLLNVEEYHSLLCLLCHDFPFHPVQKTARIILMEDALDCVISFTDFLYAFQAQFCYEEFLIKCAEIYKAISEEPQTPRETVIVPTSDPTSQAQEIHHNNGTEVTSGVIAASDGVDSMQFYRMLAPICEKLEEKSTITSLLKNIFGTAKRVTFYGFLMAFAKSDKLNKIIGKLPDKAGLLEVADEELTSPSIHQSSSTKLHQSVTKKNYIKPESITKDTNSAIDAIEDAPAISRNIPQRSAALARAQRQRKTMTQETSSDSDSTSTN